MFAESCKSVRHLHGRSSTSALESCLHSVFYHLIECVCFMLQAYSPIPSKKSKHDRSRSPSVDKEKQADWLQTLTASANKVDLYWLVSLMKYIIRIMIYILCFQSHYIFCLKQLSISYLFYLVVLFGQFSHLFSFSHSESEHS